MIRSKNYMHNLYKVNKNWINIQILMLMGGTMTL